MKKVLIVLFMCLAVGIIHAQNYNNIVNYNLNGTPVNGIKIKTNIPFMQGIGMPTIKIEGYNYGIATNISLNLVWYVYDGKFVNTSISSYGGTIPNVWLSNENGKVVIFLDQKIYFQRFTVSAFAQGREEKPEYFTGWTMVDQPLAGTAQTLVPYKNNFSGNVGIGTENPKYTLDVIGKARATEELIVGNQVSANPGTTNRLTITPYKHTGGPWTFKSRDTSAYAFLDFYYGTGQLMTFRHDRRIGILNDNPEYSLDVNGSFRTAAVAVFQSDIILKTGTDDTTPLGSYGRKFYFGNGSADNGDYIWMSRYNVSANKSDLRINIGDDNGGEDRFAVGNIMWNANGTWKDWLVVNNAGRVGIGVSDPKYPLEVNGVIRATEIKVESGWADFVFQKDYNLPSLSEVENHINTYSRLPEIPSEAEVKENGVNLGEMQVKLLQKIEELTLYIIAQDKKSEKQQEIIESLQRRLENIEK